MPMASLRFVTSAILPNNSKIPKEMYEPLWEDLHARSKENGFKIRGIWIADLAQEGASGALNERLLGNDRKLLPNKI
jgi:hypothetical protein